MIRVPFNQYKLMDPLDGGGNLLKMAEGPPLYSHWCKACQVVNRMGPCACKLEFSQSPARFVVSSRKMKRAFSNKAVLFLALCIKRKTLPTDVARLISKAIFEATLFTRTKRVGSLSYISYGAKPYQLCRIGFPVSGARLPGFIGEEAFVHLPAHIPRHLQGPAVRIRLAPITNEWTLFLPSKDPQSAVPVYFKSRGARYYQRCQIGVKTCLIGNVSLVFGSVEEGLRVKLSCE